MCFGLRTWDFFPNGISTTHVFSCRNEHHCISFYDLMKGTKHKHRREMFAYVKMLHTNKEKKITVIYGKM